MCEWCVCVRACVLCVSMCARVLYVCVCACVCMQSRAVAARRRKGDREGGPETRRDKDRNERFQPRNKNKQLNPRQRWNPSWALGRVSSTEDVFWAAFISSPGCVSTAPVLCSQRPLTLHSPRHLPFVRPPGWAAGQRGDLWRQPRAWPVCVQGRSGASSGQGARAPPLHTSRAALGE